MSKFREEWGVSTKPVPGIHGCGLWKSIRMGCQLCTLRLVLVTRFAFGIWHDCWCGNQSLRVVFLVLYDNFRGCFNGILIGEVVYGGEAELAL